jgi:hypothetical protein
MLSLALMSSIPYVTHRLQNFGASFFHLYFVGTGESKLQMIYMGSRHVFTRYGVLRLSGLRNGETVIKLLVELPRVTSGFAWG